MNKRFKKYYKELEKRFIENNPDYFKAKNYEYDSDGYRMVDLGVAKDWPIIPKSDRGKIFLSLCSDEKLHYILKINIAYEIKEAQERVKDIGCHQCKQHLFRFPFPVESSDLFVIYDDIVVGIYCDSCLFFRDQSIATCLVRKYGHYMGLKKYNERRKLYGM